MNEKHSVCVRSETGAERDLRLRCNICGEGADFVVQLELVRQFRKGGGSRLSQMPFYLCTEHEYLYKKMQKDLELKDYFVETIKEHQ
jgi:hypothetical protein